MGYISILLLSFFISLGFSIFIIPRILLISFKSIYSICQMNEKYTRV